MKGVKFVLLSLLLIQVIAMIWGTMETALAAFRQIPNGLLMVLKSLVVNSLLVLALLEVSRTVMAYFMLGRVKVTFIVDTVLALLLSEAVVTWFSGEGVERIIELIILILSLAILRFVAIRYQPPRQEAPDFSAHSLALQKLMEVVRRKGNGKKAP
ncbi:MAG: phosphate-starvation-inducible PsiE family protein [Leptospirillum sp.]|nr:phosphate-starvation-inducible PsiE family protein [Nitrospiraceae bacterium]